MKKINWLNIRIVLIISLIVFLYSFATIRNEERKIKKTEIVFTGKTSLFLKQEIVNKLLIEKFKDPKNVCKLDIFLNDLENLLNKQSMIEKSQLFVSIDGILTAVIKQKTPIARVFFNNKSNYIDYEGGTMPLSDLNTARVPIIIGRINFKNKLTIFQLCKKIYDDDFLKKNIIGIEILSDGCIMMKNRNFNYDIEFGRIADIELKMNNYKVFFQKALLDNSLSCYKKINLKYSHQVVCTL